VFKPYHKKGKYCSKKCAKEAHRVQKKKYKRRQESKDLDKARKKIVKKVLERNSKNKGEAFTEEECVKIMLRDRNNKFVHTPTNLAFILGRSKQSIEQKRNRLKNKKGRGI
jgi:hypothetical protein